MKQEYIARYGNNYQLPSPREKQLMKIFRNTCRAHGILYRPDEVFAYLNAFPDDGFEQITLF